MTIQILGPGCQRCHALEQNAREALANSGVDAEVRKISDSDAISDFGVMMTPAIAIDGELKEQGRVLSAKQIEAILSAQQ